MSLTRTVWVPAGVRRRRYLPPDPAVVRNGVPSTDTTAPAKGPPELSVTRPAIRPVWAVSARSGESRSPATVTVTLRTRGISPPRRAVVLFSGVRPAETGRTQYGPPTRCCQALGASWRLRPGMVNVAGARPGPADTSGTAPLRCPSRRRPVVMERFGMRIRQIVVAGALVALPLAAGAFLRQSPRGQDGARLFAQVLQRIEDNAVDSLSRAAIYEKAARGLVKNLKDPYADLYSPEELASFTRNSLRNRYGGLGMQIEPQDDQIVVTRVFPNTPAEHGGVMAGDHIISVDSVRVVGLKLDQVSNRLVGEPGTQVDVVFQRQGVPQLIRGRFTRAVIRPPAVPYTLVLDGGVGDRV